MKKVSFIFLFLIILQNLVFAQDKRIEEIRQNYKETNEQIAKAEKNLEDQSDIFMTELIVNKGGTSYPAVGTFRKEIKFYYTYSDREKNPYPNRILKIVAITYRSAMSELDEYYFNDNGEFVFNYSNLVSSGADNASRMYFDKGKIIRFMVGEDDITNMSFRRQDAIVQETLDEQKRLMNIFKNSIEE